MESIRQTGCPNLMTDGQQLYTRNLVSGRAIYGERLVKDGELEYRRWDPRRSKLAAYILISENYCDIRRDDTILYLGAATGTTISHISDIADKGQIYGIEISKKAFRQLLINCADRENIVPILGNARDREILSGILDEADYLYADVAQRDQVEIFISWMRRFECETGMLMLKCRSIDVSRNPRAVAKRAISEIETSGLKVESSTELQSFVKDHFALLVKRRVE